MMNIEIHNNLVTVINSPDEGLIPYLSMYLKEMADDDCTWNTWDIYDVVDDYFTVDLDQETPTFTLSVRVD